MIEIPGRGLVRMVCFGLVCWRPAVRDRVIQLVWYPVEVIDGRLQVEGGSLVSQGRETWGALCCTSPVTVILLWKGPPQQPDSRAISDKSLVSCILNPITEDPEDQSSNTRDLGRHTNCFPSHIKRSVVNSGHASARFLSVPASQVWEVTIPQSKKSNLFIWGTFFSEEPPPVANACILHVQVKFSPSTLTFSWHWGWIWGLHHCPGKLWDPPIMISQQ